MLISFSKKSRNPYGKTFHVFAENVDAETFLKILVHS
jgi:hypothetical protein